MMKISASFLPWDGCPLRPRPTTPLKIFKSDRLALAFSIDWSRSRRHPGASAPACCYNGPLEILRRHLCMAASEGKNLMQLLIRREMTKIAIMDKPHSILHEYHEPTFK